MPINRDLKYLELELKEFLKIGYELNGPFDRGFCPMNSNFHDIKINMLGQVLLQVVQIINLIIRYVQDYFLQLFKLKNRLGDQVHLPFEEIVVLEV